MTPLMFMDLEVGERFSYQNNVFEKTEDILGRLIGSGRQYFFDLDCYVEKIYNN